jgi:hypothetical protein
MGGAGMEIGADDAADQPAVQRQAQGATRKASVCIKMGAGIRQRKRHS